MSRIGRFVRIGPIAAAAFAAWGVQPALAEQPSETITLATNTASASPAYIDGLAAPAPKRIAIVIGNAEYRNAPDLGNVEADARVVAEFLAENGFRVLRYSNLTKRGFEELLQRVLYDIDKDSEVVFYFAGHGIQVAGDNYLVPADAGFESPYDLPFEAISLANVVDVIGARARIQLVVLDSCRENPFGGRAMLAEVSEALSEIQEGFSVLTAPVNSLLSFSTSPGQTAWDGGKDGNSPFTAALVEVARRSPEKPVTQILEDVRRLVFERTGGSQVPWETSTLVQSLSFALPVGPLALATDPSLGDLGAFRSMVNVTMAQAAVFNRPAGAGVDPAQPVVLTARFEREIELGPSLAELLDLPPEVPVQVVRPPSSGALVVQNTSGLQSDAAGHDLSAVGLQLLVYDRQIAPQAVPAAPGPVRDRFQLIAGERVMEVQLDLEPDPCDREAGDHLDPEGMGFAKYPNELVPERALAACLAAVERDPENGRFHYQLGRAHLALRDFEMAEAAFERARDLGHTRAWWALGSLAATEDAATRGNADAPAPAAALDFYEVGVDAGDPYAFHALGKQLLRYGESDAARQRGFELLNRAVEVGHTFAMNELGSYYIDADTPDADPARGLRYFEESAARSDIYGFNNMGVVYREGLAGVEPDVAVAVDWFTRAAEGGHPTAPAAMGRLWNGGALGEADRYAKAVAWYDLGLARGDGWSGSNAAWIIANRGVEGLTMTDAAVRAAKAAALRNEASAAEARGVLAGLPTSAVDAASQTLINDLGGSVEVDGLFGPGSAAAMAAVLETHGAPAPPQDPVGRAIALAATYWTTEEFRVDLY